MTPKEKDEKEFLTVEEAATLLRVRKYTIRHWVFIKKIPFIKLGHSDSSTVRFKRDDLAKWLEDHSYKPKES